MTMFADLIAKHNQPLVPMSVPLGRKWYVATTFTKSEFKAEEALKDEGLEAYVPRSRHFKKSKFAVRRREKIERPLMPGYCFVYFDIEREDWRHVLPLVEDWRCYDKNNGIRCLLSNNLVPKIAEANRIEEIKRSELAGEFDFTMPGINLLEGQCGEIADGPLAGLGVKIRKASAKKRLHLVLGNGWKADTKIYNFAKSEG